ncbi:hypothetical protein V529_09360 [Bacillus velezensis SQR9]|nr:hypothetical protein V529_09360 [Bacillus velezensis SQR9]
MVFGMKTIASSASPNACLLLCTTYYGKANGISFGKRCGK